MNDFIKAGMTGALLVTTASPAWADPAWIHVKTDKTMTASIDGNSIKRTGDTVTFWERYIFRPNARHVTKTIVLNEGDCVLNKTRVLHMTAYADDGSVTSTDENNSWEYITPGTLGESVNAIVCDATKTQP